MNINSFKERSTIAEIKQVLCRNFNLCMYASRPILIHKNNNIHRLIFRCCSNFHFKYVRTILEFSNYNEKYISNILGHFYFNVSTFFVNKYVIINHHFTVTCREIITIKTICMPIISKAQQMRSANFLYIFSHFDQNG